MKRADKTTGAAAEAAHDPQAGGKYRLVICKDCGAAFVASRSQHNVCSCPTCRGCSEYQCLERENAAIRAEQTGREMAKRARLRVADARWDAEVAPTVPVARRAGYGGTVVETRGRCGGAYAAVRTVRIADVSPLESARLGPERAARGAPRPGAGRTRDKQDKG